ncbi:cobalamin-5-phosphate synthase CobS, partial [Actinobacteria bacterium OK074]
AGVVPRPGGLLVGLVVGAAAVGGGAFFGAGEALRALGAVVLGTAAAEALLRHCTRRFGGVTGDVFGALAETAVTVALVVLVLG